MILCRWLVSQRKLVTAFNAIVRLAEITPDQDVSTM